MIHQTTTRPLRGPRLVKTSYGIVSFAAIIGAALLIVPASALAQAEPLDCLPSSTGPMPPDPTPYGGGMCDLGTLGGGSSVALGVSGNGSVVVGYVDQSGDISAFSWTSQSGMTELDPLSQNSNPVLSRARAANENGTIIVGNSRNDFLRTRGRVGVPRPVRWVNGNIQDLGTLLGFAADQQGNAVGVNANGKVIIGWSSGVTRQRAFRWVENGKDGVAANLKMEDLGTLRSDQTLGTSIAFNVNSKGNIVVGQAQNDNGLFRAFRWVDNGKDGVAANLEMEDLGTLRSDQTLGASRAWGVNSNGRVVVGQAQNDNDLFRAFRWVENGEDGVAANLEMQDLGTLRSDQTGFSLAYGVSADGAVVVGQAENETGEFRAFQWASGRTVGANNNPEMQDLGTLRTDQTGNSVAYSVSDDGKIVVGSADSDAGTTRAFIWRTQIQDFANLMLSFPVLANDTEIAVAQQQHVLGRLMNDTCLAEEGQACLRVGGWLANTAATGSQDIGSRKSGIATLTYGRGLDGQTTIGGTLSVNNTRLSANGFDMGTGVGVSLWGEYSEGGLERTGWQASAALGWGRESGTITRGRGLDNVMLATGDARLETLSARATLGYGFLQQDWLITSSATLAHFRTSRSAYAENGSDFNASYDALSMNRTTATLALSGERQITEQGTLILGIGVEHDLSADRAVLTGASTVPGMESFSVGSSLERRDTRGFLDIGYTHDLDDNRSLSGSLRAGQSAFGSAPQVGVSIGYNMRF